MAGGCPHFRGTRSHQPVIQAGTFPRKRHFSPLENPYNPDSTSNEYGQYGSKYSGNSINNKYGAGSPYRADSPNNPYGEGLCIYGDDNN